MQELVPLYLDLLTHLENLILQVTDVVLFFIQDFGHDIIVWTV